MLHVLPESSRRRGRPGGSALLSGVAHAALVGAALWATSGGAVTPPPAPAVAGRISYTILDPAPAPRHTGAPPAATPAAPRTGALPLPAPSAAPILNDVPSGLPPVDAPLGDPFGAVGAAPPLEGTGGAGEPGAPVATGAGQPLPAEYADVGVEALRGNPRPRYPAALERAGIAGSVTARFVIDTLGRVEMGSVEVADATHAEFERAVREVLPRLRFRPATVNGRPVRVVVLQSYEFAVRR